MPCTLFESHNLSCCSNNFDKILDKTIVSSPPPPPSQLPRALFYTIRAEKFYSTSTEPAAVAVATAAAMAAHRLTKSHRMVSLFRFRTSGKWRMAHCVHQTECERDLLLNSKFIWVRGVCECVSVSTEEQQQSEAEIRELLSCRTFVLYNKNGKFATTHVCVRKFVFMFVLIESQELQQPAPNEYVEHEMGAKHAFAHGAH